MPTPPHSAPGSGAPARSWPRVDVEAAGSARGRRGDSRGGFGRHSGIERPRPLPSDQHGFEESFDRYARMVRRLLDVPMALVTVVEQSRQVFPGASGLPSPFQASRETPLSHSICQHVVTDDAPLAIVDTRQDPRLEGNLALTEIGVGAYAGTPLRDLDGTAIGAVCALDTVPRRWTDTELEMLDDLGRACSAELAQRQLRGRTASRRHRDGTVSRRNSLLLALSERLAVTRTLADISLAVDGVTRDELGCAQAGIWVRRAGEDAARMTAPRTPPPDTLVESLVLVGNPETRWSDSSLPGTAPLTRDHPLGQALLTDSVLLLEDHAAHAETWPHLDLGTEHDEARVYLPLVVDGQAYGALALVWPQARHFDADDLGTLGTLTTYTAQAVQRAFLLQERVDAALTLQRAMLTDLPQPEHLSLAAAYLPAAARDQVGGDWYDAVVTPDGATHVIVGDVVGHDIAAAATMGQLRSMLRAFAWEHPGPAGSPARNAERLDRAAADLGLDAMATMVSARIEPSDGPHGADRPHAVQWTNAGHLPPLVVDAEGTATLLERPDRVDPMLGAIPEAARRDHPLTLEPGSTLVLFTDGLVERRGEALAVGFQRARTALAGLHDRPVAELVEGLVDAVLTEEPRDDVVVLAVRLDDSVARPIARSAF